MTQLEPPFTRSAQHLILADGRQLGYAEYGLSGGIPVLFCHGAPGSRLSIFPEMGQAASARGIRLIAPDRPGYGLSTFKHSHSLLDWTSDVRELLAHLNIQRCKLIGFSMGSLSGFACAYALPGQINHVAMVGAAAPMHIEGVLDGLSASSRDLFALARTDTATFSGIINSMATDADTVFAAMAATMSLPDQQILSERRPAFITDFSAIVAAGAEGVVNDLVLAVNQWGFSPADIRCPIDLWVGSEDTNTPPAMTRYLASALPNNRVFELHGAGHCCLYSHWDAILDRLLAAQG